MKYQARLIRYIFLSTLLIAALYVSAPAYAIQPDDGSPKKASTSLNVTNRNSNGPQNNQSPAASNKPEYTPGEVIVKLKSRVSHSVLYSMPYSRRQPVDANVLRSLKAKYRLRGERPAFKELHEKFKRANMSQAQMEEKARIKTSGKSLLKRRPVQSGQSVDLLPIYVLITDEDAQTVSDRLNQDPDVEYAQPNYIRKVQMVPNDPYYHSYGSWGQACDDLWGLKKTGCGQAWDVSQGEDVVVAVIDTGVDYAHEDLAQNIWVNTGETPGNGIDDDNNGYIDDVNGWDFAYNGNDPVDRFGHGTHVSGTIAAVANNGIGIIGVSPRAKIMVVKGLYDTGFGNDYTLANCIRYAVDNGASVLNSSWGNPGVGGILTDAFHYADSNECVCVAAAGNDNTDAGTFTPANIDTVMAVAAIDSNDKKAYFSNHGAAVEVSAPGVNILSCYPQTLPISASKALITVNSDANKMLAADILEFSAALPSRGLSGQILHANFGLPADFAGKDFSDKIALIMRGKIQFKDKVKNAFDAGAIGVIIYNNTGGGFNGTLLELSPIPAVSVSMGDGGYLMNLQAAGAAAVTIAAGELGSYQVRMGTSMACPHAAGLAALIKSKYPDDPPCAIRSRILAGADNIDSLNPGFEGRLGAGRINAFNSLVNVQPGPFMKITGIRHNLEPGGKAGSVCITLENLWQDTHGVTGVLSSDNPGVTIENNNAMFGDIMSGQSAGNENCPFMVSLGGEIRYGDSISFNLALTGPSGYAQTLNFSLTVAFFADAGALTGLPVSDPVLIYTAMADYNGDNYSDVVFIRLSTADIYRNCRDGSFEKTTAETGIAGFNKPRAAIFMDIDNDGNKDLFIADYWRSALFLNNGDGTFADISRTSGMENARLYSAIAIDYDNDGFLDIAGCLNYNTTAMTGQAVLLHNNGDNTFTDAAAGSGLSQIDYSIGGQIASLDYDNDGYQDLLFASPYKTCKTKLCRNNGDGTFTDVSTQAGIGLECRYDEGVAAGDYNNDGYTDILLTGPGNAGGDNVNGTILYKNNGDGTFTDATIEAGNVGLGTGGTWWGSDFFDYDNDGYLDIYLTNEKDLKIAKNMLYRNNGDGSFTAVTDAAFPKEVNPSYGVASIGDYNNDGAMDIYAPVSANFSSGAGAFLKNLIGANNNYVRIALAGSVSNRDAIGAKIYVRAGGRTQLRELHTSPVETQPVHFGLGKAVLIDEILIHWPSGIIQKLTYVDANQLIIVTEPGIGISRIVAIDPDTDCVGGLVAISGMNFGLTQGDGFVTFCGDRSAAVQSWSDTQITCSVPEGAVSGDVYVTTNAGRSNGVYFTLITTPQAAAEVTGRHIFYNKSAFGEQIAPDKEALLPGHKASFINYTSYNRGINGIKIDVKNLADPGGLNMASLSHYFEFHTGNNNAPGAWSIAPYPNSVTVSDGPGGEGVYRITLVWDDNAIRNTWLETKLLANDYTGLENDDTFYFGNAVGESGNDPGNAQVTIIDMLLARNNPRVLPNSAGIDFFYDYNRDGRVNASDVLIARSGQTGFMNALKLIDLPVPQAAYVPGNTTRLLRITKQEPAPRPRG